MRLYQDQRATCPQLSAYQLEAMDHALDGDSSKRPGEERNVDWKTTGVSLPSPAPIAPFERNVTLDEPDLHPRRWVVGEDLDVSFHQER